MIINLRLLITTLITLTIILILLRLFLKRKIRTSKLKNWHQLISDKFHEHQFLKVPELNDNLQQNHLFKLVFLYLNSLESLENSDFINLFSGFTPTDILLSLNPNQTISDEFLGAHVTWTYDVVSSQNDLTKTKSFLLKIRKRDKRRVLRPYLQHIHTVAENINEHTHHMRLFTNTALPGWKNVPFTHPASFETVTMDTEVKAKVKNDLEMFLKSKQYYHRLGRVWRRSYLLYGPSGTGKSSFVAAMAKLLSYDVYDLDLSKVDSNIDLKGLLLQTSPRSLILVEDFDKFVNKNIGIGSGTGVGVDTDKAVSVSVSGVLNFMDGVLSSCCEERVMVFTMTCKDEIDPVMLRPGRVDVHIYFPMCDFNNFKSMASNYLGVREHKLFSQVEEMFNSGATLSPAEIGELMMVNRNSPSRAIKSVINAMQTTSSSGGSGSGAVENGKGMPKTGWFLKSGRESMDSESGEPGIASGCRDGVKEIRKLYGLLRRKSGRKSDSFDLGT